MTLWGDPDIDQFSLQRKPRKTPLSTSTFIRIDGLCDYQGHSWEYFGSLIGLKRCTVCGLFGYCPICTLVPPLKSAQPFFCTEHTQGGQSNDSVQV